MQSVWGMRGCVEWMLVEGTTTGLEVEHFIVNILSHRVKPSDLFLLDNAGVYCTLEVRNAMKTVMHGLWDYKAPYSYDMSACER